MHAMGPIAIASIQVASRANSIHRGQSSVRRASPTHGGRWLGQTNYDALMTHHTTENIAHGIAAFQVIKLNHPTETLPVVSCKYMTFNVIIAGCISFNGDG